MCMQLLKRRRRQAWALNDDRSNSGSMPGKLGFEDERISTQQQRNERATETETEEAAEKEKAGRSEE